MSIKNDLQDKLDKFILDEIDSLNKIRKRINIVSSKSIEIMDLSNYAPVQLPTDLPKDGIRTIYIIKSNSKLDSNELNKKRNFWFNKGYQMAKVNDENIEINKENCIYVGQSKNVSGRLKEHLFLKRESTYALRLNKLLENASITIEIHEFSNNVNEVQIFEDVLWDYYKPLFGKQGKK